MKRVLRQVLFYLALVLVWGALAAAKIWPPYLFPSPLAVAESLRAGFADSSFWIGMAISLKRIALGFGLSVVLGVALGLLLASSTFLQETLGNLLVSLQSLPSICWLPMAVLWFGLTEKAVLFVVVMGSLFSIAISMESGRRQIPRLYSMAGRNLGARGLKLFVYVLFPASLPFLVSGLKQGWAFAWRALISAEMIHVTIGLGQLLMLGRDLNDINQVFAVMILIVALGLVVDVLLFRTIERRLQKKWGLAPAR